jgi:hypothetical protein
VAALLVRPPPTLRPLASYRLYFRTATLFLFLTDFLAYFLLILPAKTSGLLSATHEGRVPVSSFQQSILNFIHVSAYQNGVAASLIDSNNWLSSSDQTHRHQENPLTDTTPGPHSTDTMYAGKQEEPQPPTADLLKDTLKRTNLQCLAPGLYHCDGNCPLPSDSPSDTDTKKSLFDCLPDPASPTKSLASPVFYASTTALLLLLL